MFKFTKNKDNGVFSLSYDEKVVYEKIDEIIKSFSNIIPLKEYSIVSNNILAEEIFKRILVDEFIKLYGNLISDNDAIVIEYSKGTSVDRYTISKISNDSIGNGIIYGYSFLQI